MVLRLFCLLGRQGLVMSFCRLGLVGCIDCSGRAQWVGEDYYFTVDRYTVSGMLDPHSMSIGFSLSKTLRPFSSIPNSLLGRVVFRGTSSYTAFLTPLPFSEITGNPLV